MGRAQRIKGHSFERSVARDFRNIFGEGKRGIQSRNEEDKVPDVENKYFFIECKAHKETPIRAALRQAIKNCPPDKMPLAVLKDDYQEPCVYFLYKDFLKIIEEWYKKRSTSDQKKDNEKMLEELTIRLQNISKDIKEIGDSI